MACHNKKWDRHGQDQPESCPTSPDSNPNPFALVRLEKKLQRARTEEFYTYDDDSVVSDTGEYCWSGRPHEATKYFGPKCRTEFNSRMTWILHRKDQLLHAAADMVENIELEERPDTSDELYFPFAPQRPAQQNIDTLKPNTAPDEISVITAETGGSEFSSIACPLGSMSTLSIGTHAIERSAAPTSPRSKFIAACIRHGLNPRASLILRKKLSRSLELQHHGMGDAMGIVFAEALREMPYVDSINIADNNLTDASLCGILQAVVDIPTLTYLNLSQNKIDLASSRQLVEYLKSPECPLQTLVLRKADIDDHECQAFVLALSENRCLKSFDLSNNVLGKSEALNTVKPDVITGGEALGDLLGNSTCVIEELLVGWNMLRLEGAEAIALGLAKNNHILHLDLSYNSFGMRGGEQLGAALISNKTIQVLNLQNNNINSSACFTICVGIEENKSLRYVCFDGNPVGELGAKILMQLPCICGSRVSISAARCNLILKYEKDKIINFDSPSDEYNLKLDDPFERAICMKLIALVAAHPTYEFNKITYTPPPRNYPVGTTRRETVKRNIQAPASTAPHPDGRSAPKRDTIRKISINLIQGSQHDESLQHDTARLELITKLRQIRTAAQDQKKIETLFHHYDTDNSGTLEVEELKMLLDDIGLHISLEELDETIDMYDVDGTGELQLPEFQDFVRAQHAEASARIKSLCEIPVLLDANTRERYIPPMTGTMYMSVGDTYTNKNSGKAMSSLDYVQLMELIRKGTESTAKALLYSIQHAWLHVREAVHIFNHMNSEIHDRAEVAALILPRMIDCREARFFLVKVMNYDKVIYSRLVGLLGNSLRPILGMFDGYYALDLSVFNDRVCMAKLLEQSQTFREQCVANGVFGRASTGDLSQLGDWSSFRNAFVGKVATHISADMFNPMPKKGKLHFDFSGSPKFPGGNTAIMNDTRCVNVLKNIGLIADKQFEIVKSQLREMREQTMIDLRGNGQFKPYINRLQSEAIQLFMLQFYSTLGKRENVYQDAEAERHEGEKQAKKDVSVAAKVAIAASKFAKVLPGRASHLLTDPEEDGVNEKTVLTLFRQMSSADFDTLGDITAQDNGREEPRSRDAMLMHGFVKALPPLGLLRGSAAKTRSDREKNTGNSKRRVSSQKRKQSAKSSALELSDGFPRLLTDGMESFDFDEDVSDDESGKGDDEVYRIISSAATGERNESLAALNEGRKEKLAALGKGVRIPFGGANNATGQGQGRDDDCISWSSRHDFTRSSARHSTVEGDYNIVDGDDEEDAIIPSKQLLLDPAVSCIPEQHRSGTSMLRARQKGRVANTTPTLAEDELISSGRSSSRGGYTTASETPNPSASTVVFTTTSLHTGSSAGTLSGVVMRPSMSKKLDPATNPLRRKTLDKKETITEFDSSGSPLIRADTVEIRLQKKHNPKKLKPADTMEYLQEYNRAVSSYANDSAKSAKLMDAMIDVFSRVWILSRHLAVAIAYFDSVNTKRTEFFGTYRVDLAVALFGRVADVHNFDLVMREMTPFEIAALRCRLGVLHLFNPMKPEGNHTLNLCSREERVVAKMLAVLSVVEPGGNWIDPTFRWTFDKVPVPGWMLTSGWMTDEGVPAKGILSLEYYSGEGRRLRGCVPEVGVRKSLLHLVRIDEQDLINDINNKLSVIAGGTRIHSELVGASKAKQQSDYWHKLLCPQHSTSTLIGQGESVGSTLRRMGVSAAQRPYVLRIRDDDVAAVVEATKNALLGTGVSKTGGPAAGKETANGGNRSTRKTLKKRATRTISSGATAPTEKKVTKRGSRKK